jgi:hypothetical protein
VVARPRHVDVLLDRERHAVQRPERRAGGHLRIGRTRRAARAVLEHVHDRVEGGVDVADAMQMRVDDLDPGDLASGDPARELERGQLAEFVHVNLEGRTRAPAWGRRRL